MAKIFIYIFSILLANDILPDSISKKELKLLKQNCIELYSQRKYEEAIPLLEKYLSFRDEVQFKLYLAKSILFRKDLQEPKEEDEIFFRQEKIQIAIANYQKAERIYSEIIPTLERVTPKDKNIPSLYFLWALSNQFGENKEKAITLYKKSSRLNSSLSFAANYNIAALYEDLGQTKDSQIYFQKLFPTKDSK